jgi:DNA-binding beta-propeller fold protein YncE
MSSQAVKTTIGTPRWKGRERLRATLEFVRDFERAGHWFFKNDRWTLLRHISNYLARKQSEEHRLQDAKRHRGAKESFRLSLPSMKWGMDLRHSVSFVIALSLASVLELVPAQAANDNYVPSEPVVSTLAGSGLLGFSDGPAKTASFMQLGGIAVAPDGTVYVTDLAAQNIRAIRDGVVSTVAGASEPGMYASQRVGGNADGPAMRARFNRPSGIAVAGDGSLYVVDELNRSVRRVKDGMVTTFAGSTRNNAIDGKADGGFNLPRGIAIDGAGILYVADFGKGLREVSPDGSITTLNYPNDTGHYSVAAQGQGASLVLAYIDRTAIHIISGGQHRSLPFDNEREPYEQGLHVEHAFAITVLSSDSVAVTDERSNAVRYVRFPAGGVSAPMTRAFAGGIREGTIATGGYRDGSTDQAMVDSPYGIARSSAGSTLYVTDSGNRRVRKIGDVDARVASGGEHTTADSERSQLSDCLCRGLVQLPKHALA